MSSSVETMDGLALDRYSYSLSFSLFKVAEKEEFEHQQKELEGIWTPIITKLGQNAGGMPRGFPGAGGAPEGGASSGPTIEEVD